MHRNNEQSNKKVILFSRDPGGANCIIPLDAPLKDLNYNVNLYGKDSALKKYSESALNGINILNHIENIELKDIEEFIKNESPNLIITGTSADDMTEKYIWKAAESLNIPAFAIVDQWLNYGIRFSEYGVGEMQTYQKDKNLDYLPFKIFVMDETAKHEAIKDGIPEEKLVVTGQPYFETIKKKFKDITDLQEIRDNLSINAKEFVITYASEPIEDTYKSSGHLGYTEKTVFEDFLSELISFSEKFDKNICLIIKQHPKEKPDNYNEIEKNFKNNKIRLLIDQNTDSMSIIALSDLIVGMSSMFLIESAILGKKVLSIQTGLKIKNPFILDKIGILKSITNKNLIETELKKILNESNELYYNFKVIDNSVENIIKEVKKYL